MLLKKNKRSYKMNIQNLKLLKVKFLPVTSTRGARVKVIDLGNKDSIIISYKYKYNSASEQVASFAYGMGYDSKRISDGKVDYVIINQGFDIALMKDL